MPIFFLLIVLLYKLLTNPSILTLHISGSSFCAGVGAGEGAAATFFSFPMLSLATSKQTNKKISFYLFITRIIHGRRAGGRAGGGTEGKGRKA